MKNLVTVLLALFLVACDFSAQQEKRRQSDCRWYKDRIATIYECMETNGCLVTADDFWYLRKIEKKYNKKGCHNVFPE